MGWSTSEPSGVTWGAAAEGSKTWGAYKLELTVWTGRKTNGGDTFYLKVKATWREGTDGYSSIPAFYWFTTAGSDTDADKEKKYNRPDNANTTQWRYYTGTRNGASDGIGVGLSYTAERSNSTTLKLSPALAPSTYAVTYNGNGGSGTVASQTKTSGQSFTTRANGFSRTGYTFTGWNTAANGTGNAYAANTTYPNFPDNAVTLYAQWTPVTYTVSYNANQGTGAPASQTKTYGVNLTLSNAVPTRNGYSFVNWNTSQDGSGTSYSPGGTYSANAGATLYAQWTQSQVNPNVWVNDNGVHQITKAYANVGGVIKECEVYANVNGEIKRI